MYLCLQTLLQIEMDDTLNTNDYLANIEKLYSRDMVEKAQKLIDGHRRRFPIVKEGKFVGQVSCRSILRAVMAFAKTDAPAD